MPQQSPAEPVTATDDGAPLGDKHEPAQNGAALIKRAPLPKAVAAHVLSDDEMRRTWRLSSALAASGMFKDAQQAEQAFAKVLIGRDLGISATQSLMALDIVHGSIFMRGVLLASFVRKSRDYHYKVIERTNDRCRLLFLGYPQDEQADGLVRSARQWWEVIAEESFSVEDASRAGLSGGNWAKYPANMCFWRCISNAVKIHAPDLLAGVPVYTEADERPEPVKALGDGTGDGQPAGLDLGPEVEQIISRAATLGHAALCDRGSIELQLGDQPPERVAAWVKAAKRELDAIPAEAEVVEGEPVSGPVPPDDAQAGVPTSEAQNGSQAPAAAPEASGSPDVSMEERRAAASALLNEAEALQAAGDPRADEVFEEFERLANEVEAAGNVDQGSLAI